MLTRQKRYKVFGFCLNVFLTVVQEVVDIEIVYKKG